jgi:hypothetical protein
VFSAGVGLAPEGIDNAAPYFSLVLDSPWTEQPDARSWFQEWGVGRCGKAGVKAAEQAYDLLFQSVYRPGKPYLFCCSKPKFCPTVHPGDAPDPPGAYRKPNPTRSICSAFIIYQDRLGSNTCQREMSNHVNMCPFRNTRAGYNVSLVRAALELMVEASTECSSQAFLYDLVDVAREWLSMSPCIDAWHKIDKSSSVSAAALTSQVRRSSFWSHFYTTTHDRFTKTGSGQPQEC